MEQPWLPRIVVLLQYKYIYTTLDRVKIHKLDDAWRTRKGSLVYFGASNIASPCCTALAVFSRQNQQYQFPSVSVCLMDGSGCGYSDGSIDTCVASAVKFSSAELDGQNIDASRGQVSA